jgi:HPr kinase/phosphorylase
LGLGVLLLGESGVGKSECALELVQRGHRLVADDVVRLRSDTVGDEHRVYGRAPELIQHYMEIRGIGLIYVPDVYGADSVLDEAAVGLCCRLEHWREGARYERVGIERPLELLAGASIPRLELPVRPAGNMATLVEVAVRDEQQRQRGNNAARRLDERLRGRTAKPLHRGGLP